MYFNKYKTTKERRNKNYTKFYTCLEEYPWLLLKYSVNHWTQQEAENKDTSKLLFCI